MPLSAGATLGPYKVVSLLGRGGMGEVWRATDTNLDRDVALKVLPAALASDEQYMVRFHREAKVLASLNHPNIAAIYGLEESGDVRAIVMELVEGITLAERIAHGPIPFEQTLKLTRQMADAFEYAHDQGVVHRDLKPANVKITPAGVLKVLDFGLAKVAQEPVVAGNPETSPTLTMAATRLGVIVGTAAYMSPEQAGGNVVDRRADIWSFGVVLWEMLTGSRLFKGQSVSHTLAAVLTMEINYALLPATTPPLIVRLTKRCLEREEKQRLRDMGEARVTIEEHLANPAESAPAPAAVRHEHRVLPWAIAAALATLVALSVSLLHFLEPPPVHPTVVMQVHPPDGEELAGAVPMISPDGRKLAFVV
jgi:serine/threonine-protein kinase